MKHALAAVLAVLLPAAAMADQGVVPAADVIASLRAGLGKQIDVRLSESFAAGKLPSRDLDGVVIYEVMADKLCLFGQGKGLEMDSAALAPFARHEFGDVCVPLADVSVRMPPRQSAPVADAPPAPFYATDRARCQWVWRQGPDVGLWTEQCRFDTGLWGVTYDAEKDRFALRVNSGEPYRVLQAFRNAGGAAGLLPDLKARGLVLDDKDCVMAKVSDRLAPEGWTAWQVVPTGKKKEAFDKQVQIEIPEPPCGALGFAVDSVGFFMARDSQPDRVLYVNLGQDGTMIDLTTVTLSK